MVRGAAVEQKKMYERRRGERTLHTINPPSNFDTSFRPTRLSGDQLMSVDGLLLLFIIAYSFSNDVPGRSFASCMMMKLVNF